VKALNAHAILYGTVEITATIQICLVKLVHDYIASTFAVPLPQIWFGEYGVCSS